MNGGITMIEITVTEFARNLRSIFDKIEHNGEEIVLIRNNQKIARILPGSPLLTAVQAMGDLYKTLSDDAAENWLEESRMNQTLDNGALNPWDT